MRERSRHLLAICASKPTTMARELTATEWPRWALLGHHCWLTDHSPTVSVSLSMSLCLRVPLSPCLDLWRSCMSLRTECYWRLINGQKENAVLKDGCWRQKDREGSSSSAVVFVLIQTPPDRFVADLCVVQNVLNVVDLMRIAVDSLYCRFTGKIVLDLAGHLL